MTMKIGVVDNFNNVLDEFMCKLIDNFPDIVKLKNYYRVYKISKLCSDILPLQIFMGGCLKFETEIKEKNENFFKNKEGFIDGCSSCFGNDIGIIEYWDNISSDTKESIWEYVQTLFVIGKIYLVSNDLMTKTQTIYSSINNKEISRFENSSVNNFSDEFLTKIK